MHGDDTTPEDDQLAGTAAPAALSRQDGTPMTDDEVRAVREDARRTAAQIMSEEAV